MPENSLRRDLHAVVESRRELGPDYEDALIDSFLDRMDHAMDLRVSSRVQAELGRHAPRRLDGAAWLAITSMLLSIPLTAIAGGTGGWPATLAVWAGILALNAVYGMSRPPRAVR
ncbi:hypothetical protein [Bailinhaonella thermotolerans]|uniref:Integral membrane protein n=1 Tax=Bailinhaonella thermotolerans TaxID=1070861 RepID=A0A3A3ZZP2_9ACTN|nr:hypothetical protein [Bailinhaonella thermotolerans]RJL20837.1 hypothetical protein D5H75_38990 [Bailinhaonella thermotolerans]